MARLIRFLTIERKPEPFMTHSLQRGNPSPQAFRIQQAFRGEKEVYMVTLQDVLSAAKSLSHAEQVTLVQTIWDQLPSSDWPLPNEEWIEEAKRRSAQYDAGEMKVATWPEVQARARKKVGLGE